MKINPFKNSPWEQIIVRPQRNLYLGVCWRNSHRVNICQFRFSGNYWAPTECKTACYMLYSMWIVVIKITTIRTQKFLQPNTVKHVFFKEKFLFLKEACSIKWFPTFLAEDGLFWSSNKKDKCFTDTLREILSEDISMYHQSSVYRSPVLIWNSLGQKKSEKNFLK